MKYLRKFKESFSNILPNIDGILCQFRDIGIDYKVENYKDDSLIAVLLELKNLYSESTSSVIVKDIMEQLNDYLNDYIIVNNCTNTNRYGGRFIEYVFRKRSVNGSITREYEIFKMNKLYKSLDLNRDVDITESIESSIDLLDFSKSQLSYIIDRGFIVKKYKNSIFITGEENEYITYSGRNKQFKYNDIKDDFIPYIYSLSKEFNISEILFETPASVSSGVNVLISLDDILNDNLLNYALYTIFIYT